MKIRQLSVTILLLLVILIGGWLFFMNPLNNNPMVKGVNSKTYSPKKATPKTTSSQKFNHIFLVVEENESDSSIIGNPDAPYINSLIKKYALANNYYAVSHPSLPNYLALTSGSTDNTTTDCNPPSAGCIKNASNLADRLESAGLSWREYAESMPSACYQYNAGKYATKHNPFIYYADVINNHARCQNHVVPYVNLNSDIKNVNTTPNFAFITPDLCSDMHDCSINTGDNFLASQIPKILSSPAFTQQNSLLVITWDEGNSNNKVPAIFIGPNVKANYLSNNLYSHYSLLHTIEKNWGLAPLTSNDANAPIMKEFFKS